MADVANPTPGAGPQVARRRRAVSAALFALATGLSRIAGLVRELVATYYFGTRGQINVFTVAFYVPNLVRALVADAALGAAFVPIFNGLLEKGERERAWRVASTVLWLAFVGLSAITVLFMALAPEIMGAFNPAYRTGLAVDLARILFPIVVLLGLTGIVTAMLNAFDEFFVPAVVPVAWNAVIIGVLVGCAPFLHTTDARLYAYAAGILLGTAVQFVLPLPWLRGRGGRITLTVDWRDPAVARVFVLMLPVALGLGLINFNVGVDTWFAARIDPFLAPTAIDRAFRIYVLPQGIFSVAVAAVAFPALSRAAAGRRGEEFRDLVSTSLRQIAFLLFPASAVCLILADPIVRLLYQRGAFDAGDTTVVAQALQAFSIGLAFNGAIVLLNRAFFSLQHAWTPTWIALGNLFVNALLDWSFYRPFGIWGIPLATSITNIVAVVALVACLQPLAGSLDVRGTLASCGRILLATLALAAVADPVWRVLDQALGRSLPAQVLSLGSALALGTAAYLLAARALGLEEVALLGTVRRRLAR